MPITKYLQFYKQYQKHCVNMQAVRRCSGGSGFCEFRYEKNNVFDLYKLLVTSSGCIQNCTFGTKSS